MATSRVRRDRTHGAVAGDRRRRRTGTCSHSLTRQAAGGAPTEIDPGSACRCAIGRLGFGPWTRYKRGSELPNMAHGRLKSRPHDQPYSAQFLITLGTRCSIRQTAIWRFLFLLAGGGGSRRSRRGRPAGRRPCLQLSFAPLPSPSRARGAAARPKLRKQRRGSAARLSAGASVKVTRSTPSLQLAPASTTAAAATRTAGGEAGGQCRGELAPRPSGVPARPPNLRQKQRRRDPSRRRPPCRNAAAHAKPGSAKAEARAKAGSRPQAKALMKPLGAIAPHGGETARVHNPTVSLHCRGRPAYCRPRSFHQLELMPRPAGPGSPVRSTAAGQPQRAVAPGCPRRRACHRRPGARGRLLG